jgi:hypothetical protein
MFLMYCVMGLIMLSLVKCWFFHKSSSWYILLVLFCVWIHQYLEFWSEVFLTLLYTSNVMCSIHFIMVLPLVFLGNEWYMIEICTHYCCVSISGNWCKLFWTVKGLQHDFQKYTKYKEMQLCGTTLCTRIAETWSWSPDWFKLCNCMAQKPQW